MKYLSMLVVLFVVVVGVFYFSRQSYVEPAQSVLITNLDNIQGLTRIGGCNE